MIRTARWFMCFTLLLLSVGLTRGIAQQAPSGGTTVSSQSDGDDPDLPSFSKGNIDRNDYLRLRSEHIGLLRGLPYPPGDNPRLRALQHLDRMMKSQGPRATGVTSSWTPVGPSPLPNGQTEGFSTAVTGRITCIVIHPVHPDTLYIGTAQGGVFRSFNGGSSWTAIFDNAASLAIGALAIDPLNSTTLFVGTGEGNLSLDSFFGVGIYIIRNAETSPTLSGPYNQDPSSNNVLQYRSINKILVDPLDDNVIFVASTSGLSGASGDVYPNRPNRGLFRSRNAMSGNPTFTQLDMSAGTNTILTDCVLDPGNPNYVVAAVYGQASLGSIGGIYQTPDALDSVPIFFQTQSMQDGLNVKFGWNKVGSVFTIYATSDDSGGSLIKSTDGGSGWSPPLTSANGFCYPQCWYDIALAVDPANANNVYICGSAAGYGGGASEFKLSTDGGSNFFNSYSGLHADMHAIAIANAPNNNIIYVGNDGGIFRSSSSGASWTSCNTTGLSATQFESIALHPTDRNFSIGGTQDNGTEYLHSNSTWSLFDGGDGGFALIDQNATNTTNVTTYHTYYNQTNSQIGFSMRQNMGGGGTFYGCGGVANGMSCTDATLFYAPMALGPGNPQTVYFGSDRLYRSTNRGVTMTLVSQAPITASVPISAIGIAPQNDSVRIVGLSNGHVYLATGGSTSFTDISGTVPHYYVARAVIDPHNVNTAYVTLDGYGVPLSPLRHIWKTTNLTSGATWASASNGLPDVPVNAFVIDPLNSNSLYAGTDIGVFYSSDAGASWNPFGSGLPRVAVFDMGIQPTSGILRVATHGRGMWEIPAAPSNIYAEPLTTNWNLISLPAQVLNDTVAALFPSRVSNAFAYNGSGYQITQRMLIGQGYWLKFASSMIDTLPGYPVTSDTISVITGWNLIGTISSPLSTTSITSNPPAVVTSKFFDYNGSTYQISDTLVTGKGYWVKVSQAATLYLTASSSAVPGADLSGARIQIVPTAELPPSPPEETSSSSSNRPVTYALGQSYPNPFNPTATITYDLPADSRVSLKVYNLLGQVLATLSNGVEPAGYRSVEWNASKFASGIYFYQIEATSVTDPNISFTQVRKMMLMK